MTVGVIVSVIATSAGGRACGACPPNEGLIFGVLLPPPPPPAPGLAELICFKEDTVVAASVANCATWNAIAAIGFPD